MMHFITPVIIILLFSPLSANAEALTSGQSWLLNNRDFKRGFITGMNIGFGKSCNQSVLMCLGKIYDNYGECRECDKLMSKCHESNPFPDNETLVQSTIDLMDQLYSNKDNSLIFWGNMALLALDSLRGVDISNALVSERKRMFEWNANTKSHSPRHQYP